MGVRLATYYFQGEIIHPITVTFLRWRQAEGAKKKRGERVSRYVYAQTGGHRVTGKGVLTGVTGW